MRYTIRHCHLETIPENQVGSIVYTGTNVGRMGNSGSSTAIHLHTDLVRGFIAKPYKLHSIEFDKTSIKQLTYFIDKDLFQIEPYITTYFCDPDYHDRDGKWKIHPAYDLVPINRHDSTDNYDIYWNRSFLGQVISKGNDYSYGNYIHIGFNA